MMEDKNRPKPPIIDPTANVIALSEAATKRQDDLRVLERELTRSDIKRLEDNISHIKEVSDLRADYMEKLTVAESKRIDAIRAVDVGAVAIASERAAQQATVLANQVSQSAETLRALVATTATTVAQQLSSVTVPLIERIAILEKSSYVGSGRQAEAGPVLTELVSEVKRLRQADAGGEGKKETSKMMSGWIFSGVGLMLTLFGLILYILNKI